MICKWYSCNNELSGQRRVFCSDKCKNKYSVNKKRVNNKFKLIDLFGGKCLWCGYNKSRSALQFHHPNDDKEFGLSQSGNTKSLEKLIEEAKKCILICANCHAEHHAKYTEPIQ